jgi:hypothetical protein
MPPPLGVKTVFITLFLLIIIMNPNYTSQSFQLPPTLPQTPPKQKNPTPPKKKKKNPKKSNQVQFALPGYSLEHGQTSSGPQSEAINCEERQPGIFITVFKNS